MWRNANAPYAVGLMDLAFKQRQIRKIWLKKAAQVAGSEAVRNIIGCVASQEPDPVLLVLPDENAAKKIMRKRILPLFEDTPCLAAMKTDALRDKALTGVYLKNGFELGVGWSGSPSTLASDPVRIVCNDEVDKFAAWTGKESDPISLADVRTATYENSLVFNLSTPTTRDGLINHGWESAPIKLWFFVPCPHCGHFQRLTFDRLEWEHKDEKDGRKRAALIDLNKAAWYRCNGVDCDGRILDHHKPRMCNAGYWGTEDGGYKLYVDGREEGSLPPGNEVGMQISTLYSLAAKHKFYLIAAEWCKCQGDPMKTQNFRNSWLGEVFEEIASRLRPSLIRDKIPLSGPPLIVPSWTGAIFVAADTQKDHFYFTIRAWGYGYRSALLHYGMVRTFDELYRVSFESVFKTHAGVEHRPYHLMIDSGGNKGEFGHSRTSEVYEFAARDPGRIHPCKGASQAMNKPFALSKGVNLGTHLYLLDTGYYKDMFVRLINGKLVDTVNGVDSLTEQWLPHRDVSDDYCQQLASEHKIRDRKKNKDRWVLVTEGAANHYFDCEVTQCAAAEMSQVAVTKPPEPTAANSDPSETDWGGKRRW
jgi:phage terminase large subunit GpA-like protein